MTRFLRALLAIVGIVGLLGLVAFDASDARPRISAGSRGARTQSAPPATTTAPTTAKPIERSATPAQPNTGMRTTPPAGTAAKPGFFQRPGFMGGIMAGMLGAGLLGLLFGQGLFGNLGGLASILGLIIQLGLIGIVGYMVLRWWRSRSQPAMAGVPAGMQQTLHQSPRPAPAPVPETSKPMQNASSSGYGSAGGGGGGYGNSQPNEPVDEIGVKPEDYDTFERLLGEIQTAYSNEDTNALRTHVTPEMLGYLSEDLSANASRGVVAKLSGVKLLQGDLSEAWAEGDVQYATVALRYEIVDTLVDRNTKRIVEGDPTKPVEAVELWTFTRSARGGTWLLSAIQQVEDEGDEEPPQQQARR